MTVIVGTGGVACSQWPNPEPVVLISGHVSHANVPVGEAEAEAYSTASEGCANTVVVKEAV